ncbi:alpha-hydroxy acid oxidase [Azospirillum sp. SYSU D00513]|uniref:alpha-hydroxy acid oxidase n=1 Tax=Azospirillum sp. SYSU D00513 TaxID=2812561 RepID=UPI001A95B78A|nr:alpha-hydroxy acid oxidase [Azospirillum sp. SYSU D00513]
MSDGSAPVNSVIGGGAAPGKPAARPAAPAGAPRRLRRILSLDDFESAARRYLPKPLFGYVAGATETNASLNDNRAVFEEMRFLPRVLNNVSGRSQEAVLFGKRYASPFGIAPMGITALTGYRGDLSLARAATRANIPMIMSGSSLIPMEEVAEAAPDSWFQAYLPGEPHRIAALIDRVANAGFETLVVTVDSAVVPNRENNVRTGFKTPLDPSLRLFWEGLTHPGWAVNTFLRTLVRHGMPHFENNYAERGAPIISRNVARDFAGREHLDWTEIARIRRQWKGTLVIKGILHPEDARLARENGADGIILSNHGGRQLDGAASPMRCLRAVKEVSGDMTVMIDSGFRRGTDVLKALALGAQCVFVGRPFNYASAIAGEAGVSHAINLLSAEIRADMGLLGITSLAEMGPDKLLPAGPLLR